MFRNQCAVCGASLVSDKARTCGPKCAKEARQPKGIVGIWDNGGKTADRYTVAVDATICPANPGMRAMLGMSGSPSHPQGISQWSEGQCGPHLGIKISWTDLPPHIRGHVRARLKEE